MVCLKSISETHKENVSSLNKDFSRNIYFDSQTNESNGQDTYVYIQENVSAVNPPSGRVGIFPSISLTKFI